MRKIFWSVIGTVTVFAVAIFKAFQTGQKIEKGKRNVENAQQRKEFDKIDRATPDFDGAVDRLRNRSKR